MCSSLYINYTLTKLLLYVSFFSPHFSVFSILSTLSMTPKFISPVQTSSLNFRLTYPTASLTCALGRLTSNVTLPLKTFQRLLFSCKGSHSYAIAHKALQGFVRPLSSTSMPSTTIFWPHDILLFPHPLQSHLWCWLLFPKNAKYNHVSWSLHLLLHCLLLFPQNPQVSITSFWLVQLLWPMIYLQHSISCYYPLFFPKCILSSHTPYIDTHCPSLSSKMKTSTGQELCFVTSYIPQCLDLCPAWESRNASWVNKLFYNQKE